MTIKTTLVKKYDGCGCGCGGKSTSGDYSSPLFGGGGDIITVTGTKLPNRVKPNTNVNASVNVQNNAAVIGPFDKNACNLSSFSGGAGLSVKVEMIVNGTVVDQDTKCLPAGSNIRTYDLLWVTPNVSSNTTETVKFRVSYGGTGGHITTKKFTVTVSPSSPTQPGAGKKGQPKNKRSGLLHVKLPKINLGAGGFILKHPIESAAIGIGGAIFISSIASSLTSNLP